MPLRAKGRPHLPLISNVNPVRLGGLHCSGSRRTHIHPITAHLRKSQRYFKNIMTVFLSGLLEYEIIPFFGNPHMAGGMDGVDLAIALSSGHVLS
jgi:hypothetical protein